MITQPVVASDTVPAEIRIAVQDRGQLEHLSELVNIINLRNGEVTAVARPDQLESLRVAGFMWRAVEKRRVTAEEMCPSGWEEDPDRRWDCYPTYNQYAGLMERLAADYPHICRLEDLGPTSSIVRPHRLLFLRISDTPEIQEPEPEVLLSSTMHGDETSGFVLMLHLIHEILVGYGSDPQVTSLVDEFEIWINPNANPDGTYFGSDDTVNGAIRYYTTANGDNSGVDPNRNFPNPAEGDHPDGNQWWAETQTMMAFADDHTTTLSANLHDGAELVNYPWDTWERRHVDDDFLVHLSRGYADHTQADSPPGYMTDQSNGITHGWDWYRVAGGRQDFMTFWHSDREVTIELSRDKTPPANELDDLWSWNRRALLDFIGRAGDGIHGLVSDPSGEPLQAMIELVGHDSAEDNSFVATDPDVGDYHRLVLPGSYTVRISADGYDASVLDDVVVMSDAPAIVDVVLQPNTVTLTGHVTTPATLLPIAGATVELVATEQASTTDTEGRYILSGVPPGDYTVKISAEHFETVEKVRTVAAEATEMDFFLAPLSFRRVTILTPE